MECCCSVGADNNRWRTQSATGNHECLGCPSNHEKQFYLVWTWHWGVVARERRRIGWQRRGVNIMKEFQPSQWQLMVVADNFSLYSYVLVHLLTTFRGKYQPKETVERTVTDDPTTERNFQWGGQTPTEINPKMMHDMLSRLVANARQLLGNVTTNLAECWMHIRSKFDGGKVINHSQSGSWEYHCMGAGLQQNTWKEWGLAVWSKMTKSSPIPSFRRRSRTFC